MRVVRPAYFVVLCAVLVSTAAAGPVVEGFATYFATTTCPPGWEQVAPGRLVVAVADPTTAGVTVNAPLGDMEDRHHAHAASTTVTLPEKDIAAIADDNHGAAKHGEYPFRALLEAHPSGYPFTQLPLCRFNGGTGGNGTAANVSTGFGTVAHFTADVVACPSGWTPAASYTGRFLVPGNGEGGAVSNDAPPLASGEDRAHSHDYALTFATGEVSFDGLSGCCNDQPAAQGTVSVAGASTSASAGLPYEQLLTCTNEEQTFAASMPPGALLYHELRCPAGWELADTISGRLLVSLPEGGMPGASFGGPSIDPNPQPPNPAHDHAVNGNLTTPSASVMLVSGGGATGYAKTGTYSVSAPSESATASIPYTTLPMCQQVLDRKRNSEFFARRR